MADTAERIRQLVRLATDPAASEAEARTVALRACLEIRKHNATITIGAPHAPQPQPQPSRQSGRKRRVIVSQYAGFCRSCDQRYAAGERVAWASGEGAIHEKCNK